MEKETSKLSFVAAHVGIIVFHILLGLLFYYSQTQPNIWGYDSRKVVKTAAVVLIIVSLMGLIPVLNGKDYTIK
jgi:hypothetical protein